MALEAFLAFEAFTFEVLPLVGWFGVRLRQWAALPTARRAPSKDDVGTLGSRLPC